jgi:hypothetical protein
MNIWINLTYLTLSGMDRRINPIIGNDLSVPPRVSPHEASQGSSESGNGTIGTPSHILLYKGVTLTHRPRHKSWQDEGVMLTYCQRHTNWQPFTRALYQTQNWILRCGPSCGPYSNPTPISTSGSFLLFRYIQAMTWH